MVVGVTVLPLRAGYTQGMAPIEQYRMSQAAEVALAKSAAPAAVSSEAEILVLGERRYERAVPGQNGFVCLVERSWSVDFGEDQFWNPKVRSPMCFNAVAARSVLQQYLTRTEQVLSGLSQAEMRQRSRAASPASGAMCYMLSKDGYLGDDVAGPWHPHVMFFIPSATAGDWGANVARSPVYMPPATRAEPFATFAVPVPRWSDGTPDTAGMR